MTISVREVLDKLGLAVDVSLFKEARGVLFVGEYIVNAVGADLQGCVFYRCILEDSAFTKDALYIDCKALASCTIKNVFEFVNRFKGEDFVAYLQGADLQDADLEGVNLQGANLFRANLQGANLKNTNLFRAELQGANLQGAKLQGADLRDSDLYEANLQRAGLQGTMLNDANLEGADLRGANLEGAYLQRAMLEGADLRRANLKNVNLERASYNVFTRGSFYSYQLSVMQESSDGNEGEYGD